MVNPDHYTDHELWVATFTEEETARSRWPSSPLHFTTGSITPAEIKWSSIKLPDRELQLAFLLAAIVMIMISRREARGSWSFLSKN